MTIALNENLMRKLKKPRDNGLTDDECVALNLFWRKKVNVLLLARVFHVSKNTIYARAITGPVDNHSIHVGSIERINKLIDQLGEEKAWNRYVTNEMVEAVHAEVKAELARRAA